MSEEIPRENDTSAPAAPPSNNESNAQATKSDDSAGLDLRQAAHDFQDRNGQHHPIAEFLYQLTKMLTDDNTEIIEWSDGRIRVHHPERLEAEVLHKYFRHSKFASFQRQLNYFGFRKIAGKGKMSPCSYVNDAATSDIRSLLLIKRKTNGSAARKAAMQQRAGLGAMNPALAGMNLQALASAGGQPLSLLNGQAINSAMALLQENALRAGLGQMPLQQGNPQAQLNLLALQHQQQLQELQQQQLRNNQQVQQAQDQQNRNSLGGNSTQQQDGSSTAAAPAPNSGSHPNIQQLQAQLAAISAQAGINVNALNQSALGLANSMQAPASLQNTKPAASSNPASAALNAQNSSNPATAAMDAAKGQTNTNLFESAANLKSLLNEHAGNEAAAAQNAAQRQNNMASQVLLNRLPSSGTIFPENSTLSFGAMLGSSNRLSSLLSLNSFVGSREASLADLAAASNMSQFGAPAAGISQLQMTEAASKLRANNNS